MHASIIIPAYNAEHTLAECLTACLAQDYPDFDVLVIDDGSTDSTESVAGNFDTVRYHRQPNAGPAAARNTGARITGGDLLVYTDADCIPRTDWLRHLVNAMEEGAVAAGGTYDIANPHSRLARVVQSEIAVRHRQFNRNVDFLGSFNVAYRRDAFDAAGGFDESYRQASGEDNDLAYRLNDRGGCLVFTPEAIVAHYHPERLLPYLRTQARHGYWRVKLYRNHPNRTAGDQYAGWPDLLAPPFGLMLLFLLPVLPLVGIWRGHLAGALGIVAGLVLVYWALHTPLAHRLRGTLSGGDLLYFLFVASLRDIARGLGLVVGLWTFSSRNGSRV